MYLFTVSDPRFKAFMGEDKFENELLIKWGWPEDIWFHVDNYSSAHVYVRLPQSDMTIDDIPQVVLDELCQLTRENSIEGSKQPSVDIVYTNWANLKKSLSMDVGTIGFHDDAKVKKVRNVSRNKEMSKRLEKTKEHLAKPDLEAERTQRDREELKKQKVKRKAQIKQEAQDRERAITAHRQKHYMDIPTSNVDTTTEVNHVIYSQTSVSIHLQLQGDGTVESCRDIEDDFM